MTFSERLRPPILWWVVVAVVALTFVVAVAVFLPPIFLLIALVVAIGVEIALMVAFSATVVVSADGVRVGRALLDWPYVGSMTTLTRDQVRRRMGPEADPRAFVMYRPFAEEAIEIAVTDPADPHPYWLVSSRDAEALAAAIEKAKVGA